MTYCFVENVNVSKSSDYRVFVLMFYNKTGSPIHVETTQSPFQMLYRNSVVKKWFNMFGEPVRVVSLGTVDKNRSGEATQFLRQKIVKQGGHVVNVNSVETSLNDKKVVNYRMSDEAQKKLVNSFVRKFGVKKPTPVKHVGQRFTKEELIMLVSKMADSMGTVEYNFLLKMVKHFDVKKQRSVIVYTPEFFNNGRMTEKDIKSLVNKTRWFFTPVFPLRRKYSNEYVLTRKAKQLLYNV